MEHLVSLLDRCGSVDKAAREAAEQSIRDALAASPHESLVMLFQVGVSNDPALCDERIAQQSLLRAKLFINNEMDERDWAGTDALEAIKELTISNVALVSRVRRRVLDEVMRTIHSSFKWPRFTERCFVLITEARERSDDALAAALGALYTFTKRFKTFGLEPQKVQEGICATLLDSLPELLGVTASYETLKYIFKIFECICESLTTAGTRVGAAKFEPWFDFMFAFPTEHFSRVSETQGGGAQQYREYVKCVKRIGLVSFGLLQEFTNKKKPSDLASFFAKKYAVSFYEMWISWIRVCRNSNDRELHKKSAMSAMRFVKMCAFMPDAYQAVVHGTALDVICSELFPFLCLNDDDEAAFAGDLEDFSRYMLDEATGEYSERQCASNTILALCSFNKKFHDSSIIFQLLGWLNNGLDEAESPRTFGHIHLLGILRPKLKKIDEVWNHQLEPVIVDKIVPKTRSPNASIRYKGTWLCGHYARVPMRDEAHFSAFVQLVLEMAQDGDANVRLGAMNALSNYINMKRFRPFLRTVLNPLVEEILAIMEKVNAPFLPMLLNFLAENFGPELSGLVPQLVARLVQQFMAGHHDLALQEQMEVPEDEVGISKYEANAIATMSALRAINQLVLSSEHNKAAVPHFMPEILRLFNHIIQAADNEEFLDVGIEILQHALFISEGVISEETWYLVPKIHRAIMDGAVDYFAKFEPVLDNYVSSGRDFFVANADVIRAFYEICEKMLLSDVVASDDDKKAAPQLIESIFHNCKDVSGAFDAHAPSFVTLLLQALRSEGNEGTKVRIWLCCALCDALWYNSALTLQVIFSSGAYPYVFDGFFGFMRELIAPKPTKGAKKRGGTKKRGGDDVVDPAAALQGADSPLSMLNRKVVALGLVSMLGAVSSGDYGVDLSYVTEAIGLVNYCVSANAQQYTQRLRYIEYWREQEKARGSGAAEDDGDDEEMEDVDLSNDIANGAASGHMRDYADNTYDDEDEGAGADEDEDEDEDEDKFGDGGDEGDDYTSPIDKVNEARYFVEWIEAAASAGLPHYSQNAAQLDAEALGGAATVTDLYIKVVEESMESDRREHIERSAKWEQDTSA